MSKAIDKTGAYEMTTHLAVGHRLHAPGSVHYLSHEEASSLLDAGAVKPARSKRGAYDLPTLAEYVAAGYPAHYYRLFIQNETDDVPFDATDAFAEGKEAAPTPAEWHTVAQGEGRVATIAGDTIAQETADESSVEVASIGDVPAPVDDEPTVEAGPSAEIAPTDDGKNKRARRNRDGAATTQSGDKR